MQKTVNETLQTGIVCEYVNVSFYQLYVISLPLASQEELQKLY